MEQVKHIRGMIASYLDGRFGAILKLFSTHDPAIVVKRFGTVVYL